MGRIWFGASSINDQTVTSGSEDSTLSEVENIMIKALIFDFDGLILDTETVAYQSWQEIYQEYHCTLSLEKWLLRVGGSIDLFDAHIYLENLIGQSISRKETR